LAQKAAHKMLVALTIGTSTKRLQEKSTTVFQQITSLSITFTKTTNVNLTGLFFTTTNQQ
jgi:hypothetical protein